MRNGKKEGKGIYCFKNGDKRMGDFFNGEHVGKHVTLTKDGEVKAEYFSLKLWIYYYFYLIFFFVAVKFI